MITWPTSVRVQNLTLKYVTDASTNTMAGSGIMSVREKKGARQWKLDITTTRLTPQAMKDFAAFRFSLRGSLIPFEYRITNKDINNVVITGMVNDETLTTSNLGNLVSGDFTSIAGRIRRVLSIVGNNIVITPPLTTTPTFPILAGNATCMWYAEDVDDNVVVFNKKSNQSPSDSVTLTAIEES